MTALFILEQEILRFEQHLKDGGRAKGTIEKYMRDVIGFLTWLGEGSVTMEAAIRWRDYLQKEQELKSGTINSKLAALNDLFAFLGLEGYHMKYFQIQRQLFRSPDRELTVEEYRRLVKTAKKLGLDRLAMILETLCAIGLRVSELKSITIQALETGRVEISLKGKVRVIMIPEKLRQKLGQYAKKHQITSGAIFATRSGRCIGRRQVWAEMKDLCDKAGVERSKVFPHNLRHLFARTYYEKYHNIVHLADILGHSSVETTRIYLISTGKEHAQELEQLGLVS